MEGGLDQETKILMRNRCNLISRSLKTLRYMPCRMKISDIEGAATLVALISIVNTTRKTCVALVIIDRGGLKRLGYASIMIKSTMLMGNA